jgi:hypothetical protein
MPVMARASEESEDAERDGGGARGKEHGADDLLPGRDGADGEIGIDASDDAGERGGEARTRECGRRGGADEDVGIGVRILRDGVIEGRGRIFGERAVLAVFGDADDGEVATTKIAEDAADGRTGAASGVMGELAGEGLRWSRAVRFRTGLAVRAKAPAARSAGAAPFGHRREV